MQDLQTSLSTGRHVQARGQQWRIVSTEHFDQCAVVTLHGLDDSNLGETTRLVAPFDRIRPQTASTRIVRASRHAALVAAVRAITVSHRWNACWTTTTARIDLREWQLTPARAAVNGVTRILLADEVGLGKTIEAALVLSELAARGLARRALVLTPASLREQWALEMANRFGLAPRVFDQASLKALVATLPIDVNPWATADVIVSSIDLVKRPEVRVAVDAVPFDVLIVDEAHHITAGSDRAALVCDLASRIPWVILATATPHSGDDSAYAFLQRVGEAGDDDMKVFRRTAVDVYSTPTQRVRVVPVAPTSAERALLDATLSYSRALWRATGNAHDGAGLVGTVIARRAASCAHSVWRTLQRRRALLSGATVESSQSALPWDEGETDDGSDTDSLLSIRGLSDPIAECALLDRLIALADRARDSSSKIGVIKRLLRRSTDTAIVFSEYRDTVEWVANELARVTTVTTIHGGVSARERRINIEAFTAGRVRVLVASDAAGEGLNLQATCRLVVNLEMPWNPLRLQQRIGRVARIGQTRRVHAIHLVHRESFEDDVLGRVERRRIKAATALRSHTTSAHEEIGWEQTTRRLARLLLRGSPPTSRCDAPVVATEGRFRPSHAGLALYACDLVDVSGRLVQRELLPLVCESTASPERLAGDACLLALARDTFEERAITLQLALRDFSESLERRVVGLIEAIDQRDHERLFQGSLFDRRAEQEAEARATARSGWRSHLLRTLERAQAMRAIKCGEPRLIAVWSW